MKMKYAIFTKSAKPIGDPEYCGCPTYWSVDFVEDTKEEALDTLQCFGPDNCCVAKLEEVPDSTQPGDMSEGIKYRVEVPTVRTAVFYVEAGSQEEAKLLVERGDVEESDASIEDDYGVHQKPVSAWTVELDDDF
jgi:hypothetical protein